MKPAVDKSDIFYALFPVLIGGVVYYGFCPDVVFVKAVDEWFKVTADEHIFIQGIIRSYLFDFLWGYSLAYCIRLFLSDNARGRIEGILIPLGFGLLLELLQMFGIAAGTADINDVAAELVGIIIANITIRKEVENEKVG